MGSESLKLSTGHQQGVDSTDPVESGRWERFTSSVLARAKIHETQMKVVDRKFRELVGEGVKWKFKCKPLIILFLGICEAVLRIWVGISDLSSLWRLCCGLLCRVTFNTGLWIVGRQKKKPTKAIWYD